MTMTTTMAQTIGTNTAGSLKMENVPMDEDDVEAKGGTVAEKLELKCTLKSYYFNSKLFSRKQFLKYKTKFILY